MPSTLFAYLKGAVSNADDTDPETSSSFYNPPMSATHNVLYYRRETVSLDVAETRVIAFQDYASTQWSSVMVRVIGEAKLTTVGFSWDGSTAITGITAGYGTDRHPGYISMVTTNVTSFTLQGLAAGTQVEYLAMILIEDNSL